MHTGGMLALRYANGTGSAMTLSVYVGTQRLQQVSLLSTGSWNAWAPRRSPHSSLPAPPPSPTASDTTDSGNVNLDRLTVAWGTAGGARRAGGGERGAGRRHGRADRTRRLRAAEPPGPPGPPLDG